MRGRESLSVDCVAFVSHLRELHDQLDAAVLDVVLRTHKIVFPNARILIQMSLLGSPAVGKLSEISQGVLLEVIDSLIGDMGQTTDHYTDHGSITIPISIILGRAKS